MRNQVGKVFKIGSEVRRRNRILEFNLTPHPGPLLVRRGEGELFCGTFSRRRCWRTNTGLISVARGLVRSRSLGSREPSVSPNSFRRFPSGSSQRIKYRSRILCCRRRRRHGGRMDEMCRSDGAWNFVSGRVLQLCRAAGAGMVAGRRWNTQKPHKQQLGILWPGRRISRERPGILREASGFRGESPGFRGRWSGFSGNGSGQRGRRRDFAGAAQTWRERGRISRAGRRIFRERAGTLRERPRILRERRRQRRRAAVQPSLRASHPVWPWLRPGRFLVFPSLR